MTFIPPWEVALASVTGGYNKYMLSGYEKEVQLFKSLLSLEEGKSSGTSMLIVSPMASLQLSLINQELGDNCNTKVLYIHGVISSESFTILFQINSFLGNEEPLRTFEEMAISINEWLCENPRKVLVIVLQSFERFVSSNQHFLYTLLELTISSRVIVIGVTSRCDTIDMMEKRVKSRFSQNILYLPYPKTFDQYLKCIQNALSPEADRLANDKKYYESVQQVMKDHMVTSYLQSSFEICKDPSKVLHIFIEALLNCSNGKLNVTLVHKNIGCLPDTLPELSLSQWCALVALKRAISKQPDELCNFDSLFEEYSQGFTASATVCDSSVMARKFSRTVLRAAVDQLIHSGILSSSKSINGETFDTREELLSRIPLNQLPELISRNSSCPDSLRKLASEVL